MSILQKLFHKHSWEDVLTDGDYEVGHCTTGFCKCGKAFMLKEGYGKHLGGYFSQKIELTKEQFHKAREKQIEWLKENKPTPNKEEANDTSR